MFDDNRMEESDLLIRSILESGQEEVPAHVWEGVADGLDKAARRRSRVLWLGRAAAVAAAAAVVVGVFFSRSTDEIVVPEAKGDMIAVVSEPAPESGNTEEILLAHVESDNVFKPADAATGIYVMEIVTEPETEEVTAQDVIQTAPQETVEPVKEAAEPIKENIPAEIKTEIEDSFDWEEEEDIKRKKIKASLTVSGIAGTNNPQNKGGIGPLRSPGIFKSPEKTTVEQTSAQTTYGIPLSFGAGIKLRFNDHWSLGMGLNYSLLTSKFNGKYTKVEDGVASLPITATIHNSLHYIGIPINAYYNIVSRDFINFYAYAGGTVEKCVANRYEVQTTPVINHEESVKGVQLSANAGIGVEFMLGRHIGIYIDPSLRYYFHCSQPKSIRTAQPLMLGFEMGLRFNL